MSPETHAFDVTMDKVVHMEIFHTFSDSLKLGSNQDDV